MNKVTLTTKELGELDVLVLTMAKLFRDGSTQQYLTIRKVLDDWVESIAENRVEALTAPEFTKEELDALIQNCQMVQNEWDTDESELIKKLTKLRALAGDTK